MRGLSTSSTELAATVIALAAARDEIAAAEARRQAEADQQAEAERQAEADRQAEAERQAEADRQAEAERQAAEARAEEESEAAAAAAAAAVLTAADGSDAAANTLDGTAAQGGEEATAAGSAEQVAEPAAAAEEPAPQQPVAVRDQNPVTVSSLTRTRYVAPKYPRTAQRRGVTGWVDVVFTVSRDGTTRDIEVRRAEPDGVFDGSAKRAVEKWEFEPVVENGEIVEKRAGVRLMFALE
jgi:TonB family protein